MASNKQVSVPLNVQLREQTYSALTSRVRDANPADVLSNKASTLFENLADGGVMLTSDQVREIEATIGKPIERGQDVVIAAQKGVGVEDGANVFKVHLDPAWVEALAIRAKEVDRPIDALVTDAMDTGFENDWLYCLKFEGTRRTFNPEHEAFFESLTGKQLFTVDDIITALRKKKKLPALISEAEAVPV